MTRLDAAHARYDHTRGYLPGPVYELLAASTNQEDYVALTFDPCGNENCPNKLVSQTSQRLGECSACQDFGPPCSHGARGESPTGEAKDCQCPGCMGAACDQAEYLFSDR